MRWDRKRVGGSASGRAEKFEETFCAFKRFRGEGCASSCDQRCTRSIVDAYESVIKYREECSFSSFQQSVKLGSG